MPKEFPRSRRVGDQIQRELADMIRREVKDPRLSPMITVAEVEVSQDLSVAKIYITVLDENGEQSAEILNHASGFMRRELGKRLNLRKIPDLRFILDDTSKKGEYISALIDRAIHEDQNK